ncbi:MAG TPA: hypothetical protein DEQ77_01575, partial [Candidatus Omnitrophica bacterium]|nr:hypothetical protein [Candidatus Omnitrophota bacterium]
MFKRKILRNSKGLQDYSFPPRSKSAIIIYAVSMAGIACALTSFVVPFSVEYSRLIMAFTVPILAVSLFINTCVFDSFIKKIKGRKKNTGVSSDKRADDNTRNDSPMASSSLLAEGINSPLLQYPQAPAYLKISSTNLPKRAWDMMASLSPGSQLSLKHFTSSSVVAVASLNGAIADTLLRKEVEDINRFVDIWKNNTRESDEVLFPVAYLLTMNNQTPKVLNEKGVYMFNLSKIKT